MKLTTNDLRALINGGVDMARENIDKRQKMFPCLSSMDDFDKLEQNLCFSDLCILEHSIKSYQEETGDVDLLRNTTLIKWWLNEITTEEFMEKMGVEIS